MPDALAVLSADHQRIFELSNWLTGASGDPRGDRKQRLHVAKQLIIEVSTHEAVEELLFWPLVRDRLPGGDALARPALEHEAGLKRLLHSMDHMSPVNEEFRTLCFHTASALRDHLTYEQNQIWPKIQLHVPKKELAALGERMAAARRRAPTRPHPHISAQPQVLSTVGMAAALVDRARDAVTRRGRAGSFPTGLLAVGDGRRDQRQVGQRLRDVAE